MLYWIIRFKNVDAGRMIMANNYIFSNSFFFSKIYEKGFQVGFRWCFRFWLYIVYLALGCIIQKRFGIECNSTSFPLLCVVPRVVLLVLSIWRFVIWRDSVYGFTTLKMKISDFDFDGAVKKRKRDLIWIFLYSVENGWSN